ncbi:MAG: sigma-54 dependent transcriptional regulator, partial [Bacteroidota bacterium]
MDTQEIQTIKQRFGIIGYSPKLNRAIEIAATVAGTDSSVLIVGESGSGKETFSKIIHQLSARKHGEFIAINCGAIPEGTINSELFGHEKGAFTGASEARKGYFEVTNNGTIFLDEVAEMPLETQAMLLRVLEYGEFLRVGSNKVKKTNVRVVAATNVDLQERVAQGKFREDLYYRFSITIEVPPLRERGNDVDLLFRKFAIDFAERNRTKPIILDESAKQVLLNFRFPGNIRQLKNIVDQVSVLAQDRMVDAPKLLEFLPSEQSSRLPVLADGLNQKNGNASKGDFSERDILYKVLFDLRNGMVDLGKEVTELKKMILNILDSDVPNNEVFQDNKHLFHDL